jgi:hypothetical protein
MPEKSVLRLLLGESQFAKFAFSLSLRNIPVLVLVSNLFCKILSQMIPAVLFPWVEMRPGFPRERLHIQPEVVPTLFPKYLLAQDALHFGAKCELIFCQEACVKA